MTVVMALERDRFMVVTTLQNNVQEQLWFILPLFLSHRVLSLP